MKKTILALSAITISLAFLAGCTETHRPAAAGAPYQTVGKDGRSTFCGGAMQAILLTSRDGETPPGMPWM